MAPRNTMKHFVFMKIRAEKYGLLKRKACFARPQRVLNLWPGAYRCVTCIATATAIFGLALNGDGLFRFRESPIRMFTTADGLPSNIVMTVLTAHDGTV